MKKITVRNLIDFKAKSDRAKITFVNKLRAEKIKVKGDDGGDYWISCVSAIRNVFKLNDGSLLEKKIAEIQEKLKGEDRKQTKDQYQSNIDILHRFGDFDLQSIRPTARITILVQSDSKAILDIKGLPIEAKPSHVFSFSENGSDEIGAVWFVAKKGGYEENELGMFVDICYRYLDTHYSRDYFVNTSYCMAVDVFSGKVLRYQEIENGKVHSAIDTTIDHFKKF